MRSYPVHYAVSRPATFTRLQLAMRMVAFLALGVLGLSFGAVFLFAYLALPVYAASRLGNGRASLAYAEQDGPRVVRALRWFAAVSAWAALVADRLPGASPDEVVTLTIETRTPPAEPTAGAALWRVITGLPSALVLGVLGFVGSFVWLWAALSILIAQQVGPHAFHYLTGLQRWSVRLLAYQEIGRASCRERV